MVQVDPKFVHNTQDSLSGVQRWGGKRTALSIHFGAGGQLEDTRLSPAPPPPPPTSAQISYAGMGSASTFTEEAGRLLGPRVSGVQRMGQRGRQSWRHAIKELAQGIMKPLHTNGQSCSTDHKDDTNLWFDSHTAPIGVQCHCATFGDGSEQT